MIIKNNTKSVKALKASGCPTLRLFPGFNDIDEDIDLDEYKNKASIALFETGDLVFNKGELSPKDAELARAAKEKNDMLNKAQKINKQNTKKLEKNAETKKADDKLIKEQSQKISKQEKLIADLMKRMDAIENIADDEPDKKDPKVKDK